MKKTLKKFIESIKDTNILTIILYASPLHGWMLDKFGGVLCLIAIVVVILSILLKYNTKIAALLEEEE